MKNPPLYLFILLAGILIASCGESLEQKGSHEYISEVKEWHNKRINNLKKESGWLNLVGLFWLKEGENSFGSAKSNDVVFPDGKAPDVIGKFVLRDSTVEVFVNDGVEVFNGDNRITNQIMINDMQGQPTVLKYASLRWFVIKRGDRYGIRLRDLEADLLKSFAGIETFPINSDWKYEAEFIAYDPPKEIAVPSILGNIDIEKSPGALKFVKDGNEYTLDAMEGGNSYFIVFADETSGSETYGGGRFIYVPKADSTGKIYIDFNKAYNPPCVFTKYATCPLPPKQNYLKLKILAGEKNYAH